MAAGGALNAAAQDVAAPKARSAAGEAQRKRASGPEKSAEQPQGRLGRHLQGTRCRPEGARGQQGGRGRKAGQHVMRSGGLDQKRMARALAIRGQAYRRDKKPAQAISDLQSALWLKGGLSESERAAALAARAEAYRDAGLPEPPLPAHVQTVARPAGRRRPRRPWPSPRRPRPAALRPPARALRQAKSRRAASARSSRRCSAAATRRAHPHPRPARLHRRRQPPPCRPRAPPSPPCRPGATARMLRRSRRRPRSRPSPQPRRRPRPSPPPESTSFSSRRSAAARLRKARRQGQRSAGATARGRPPQHRGNDLRRHGHVIGGEPGPYADAAETRTICTTLRNTGVDCMVVTK